MMVALTKHSRYTLRIAISIMFSVAIGWASFVYAESDIVKIDRLIRDTPKINVANTSAGADGDIIVAPRHSVGMSGSGANRMEEFEEKKRLTRTLEKFVAFNPNADALFPCSIVQGKSLPDGVLSPVLTPRNAAVITVTDLVASGQNSSYSRRIPNPTLAQVTDAIGQILAQNLVSEQPAKLTYSRTSISSAEEGVLKPSPLS